MPSIGINIYSFCVCDVEGKRLNLNNLVENKSIVDVFRNSSSPEQAISRIIVQKNKFIRLKIMKLFRRKISKALGICSICMGE